MYYLVTDRTGDIIAKGTEEECNFAMKAMIAYGIAADRMFVCPAQHFDAKGEDVYEAD